MAMKKATTHDNDSADSTFSMIPTINGYHSHPSDGKKRPQILRDLPQNYQPIDGSRSQREPTNIVPLLSDESDTVDGAATTFKTRSQTKEFHQHIEKEYKELQRSEARYCYYINDPVFVKRAEEELYRAADGTFFIRPVEENERTSGVEYCLVFVCHKRLASVGICCNQNRRNFWFKSGYGPGSEVTRVYTGIDVLIRHKQENPFYELQYPFQISLYRPIDPKFELCIPLPDEVRAMDCHNTILHQLVIEGLMQHFNELIGISKNDVHPLYEKAQFIVKKMNGRNKQGQTPLILAIQAEKSEFVELLLDNKVDANITDIEGYSPLHYACRQANPEMLKKLIDRGADPYYFNQKKTTDGVRQWNLSAFHYLAMAKGVSAENTKRCAKYLVDEGCPLMPLTNDEKSPFDIAEINNNKAYRCVKNFLRRHEFNDLTPIDVSSRNEAKTVLSTLVCSNTYGKIKRCLKQYGRNTDFFQGDGLFLLYKTRKSRSQPNEEFGLCVYHAGKVSVYPISQNHTHSTMDLSKPPRKVMFKFSLITDTPKDDHAPVILYRRCEELIYNHTKYKGILPTVLKEYVRKEYGDTVTIKAATLLIPNNQPDPPTDEEEPDIEDASLPPAIDRFDISQIHSVKLLNENHRRFIWTAKVRLDPTTSFPIVIKDYLPIEDIDSYKQYRLNELNNLSRHRDDSTDEEFPYEYSPYIRREYKHESQLLRKHFKNHPFIVQSFICDHHLKRDLRIFMEYLPRGDLHSYLIRLNQDSLDPLINAYDWIYQLAQVMAYLSNKKIVHRDLATRNILLQEKNHIKLSDFGLSRFEGVIPEGKDCILSPRWTAPECLNRHQKISSSSDVWSFAVVIWEIYSLGARPYETQINDNSQPLVRLLKRFLVEEGRRLSRPSYCSESMYDFMGRCWNGDVDKRSRFVDIIDDLNGMNTKKDPIIPFTDGEREAWRKAKEKYRLIHPQVPTLTTKDTDYVGVIDYENDDKDTIVMQL